MHHNGQKIAKRLTEANIVAALQNERGWRLIRVNWKKRTIHLVNGFGKRKVVLLPV
jgi:hypothetical protein